MDENGNKKQLMRTMMFTRGEKIGLIEVRFPSSEICILGCQEKGDVRTCKRDCSGMLSLNILVYTLCAGTLQFPRTSRVTLKLCLWIK